MKIFILAVTRQENVIVNITNTELPIDINYFFDDGVTNGGGEAIPIAWTTLDTATTLNNAIKTSAIALMKQQLDYTVDPVNDQLFIMCGFLGI